MSLVLLGIVIGVHGVRGQLRFRSFTTAACDLGSYGALRDKTGIEYELSSLRLVKGDIVIGSLSGVSSRDEAEALIGVELFVPREALGDDSGDDSYYHVDLVGLLVFDEAGEKLGEVVNVCNYGGGDLLEIRILSGADILLLFNRDNVLSIGEGIILSSLGVESLSHVAG